MSKDITKIHDLVFRQSLSHKIVARDLLENHLDEKILDIIDLETLQLCNTSFIDEKIQESISDIVYTTTLKDGNPGYVSFLFEHQSTPSRIMPLRFLRYQLDIMEEHFKQCPKGKRKIPAVFCFLFYNGTRTPYPYSLNIFDLFYDRQLGEQTLAKPAILIDVTSMPDEEIKQHTVIGPLEWGQKHVRDDDMSPSLDIFIELLITIYNNPEIFINTDVYINTLLCYIVSEGNIKQQDEFINKLQTIPNLGEKTMGTLAQRWLAEGEAKGKAEGEAKGKLEVAKSMLNAGSDIAFITKVTGLPEELIIE